MPKTLLPPQPAETGSSAVGEWSPEPARITVEQYHAMGEAGILTPADRVELLDGVIVRKPTKGPLHTYVVKTLEAELRQIVSEHIIRKEEPVVL